MNEVNGLIRIGVDIGGTKISAGIVDEAYRITATKRIPTGASREPDAIVRDIADLCLSLASENGYSPKDIEKIGLAVPGAVIPETGILVYSCNLPFREFPLAKAVSEKTGVANVKLANDANAAAIGESVAGASKGTRSSVMITLGTGIGGGIIIDGKIFCGVNGAAGELGHVVIDPSGPLCTCGRNGCFEVFASATGLVRMTKEKIRKCLILHSESAMIGMTGGNPENAGARTAFDAAKRGDAAASEVIDEFCGYLAMGITNLINTFQPEVLLIGGGLSGEGDNLLRPLLPYIGKEQYTRDFSIKTVVKIAVLGNSAGMIGAAAL